MFVIRLQNETKGEVQSKMNCPKCQKRTNVIDTRRSLGGGSVYRIRKCPRCGFSFRTMETKLRFDEKEARRDA